MRCISPLLIRTSGRRDFVPCGKCNFCLEVRRGDWTFRIMQEMKTANTAKFLTLTYEDAPMNELGELQLCKRDVQLFKKRLRKENSKRVEWPLRYYTVGEYGTVTMRPHYHSIIFNLHNDVISMLPSVWQHGMCHVGEVSQASIHYVTKYVINRSMDYGGREPPFAMMSKRPGLGRRYLETHTDWHRSDKRNYTQVNGKIGRLPRYYKDQIFTQYERAQMASTCVEVADTQYFDEVSRLARFHSDPYHYFDERIRYAHDAVKSKSNKLNRF